MSNWLSPYSRALLLITLLFACAVNAQQINIAGPLGSGAFGTSVTMLPNGNIVVTDPDWNTDYGAVYLYAPDGQTLISTVTGGTSGDRVGSGGITVLGSGNYVISSPLWSNPNTAAAAAGAATFCTMGGGVGTGNATIDESNSLVGSHANDQVGYHVYVLTNHNYVVGSYGWNGGLGAVTWGSGGSGAVGVVSSDNSLVGSSAGDDIGYYSATPGFGIVPLSNGNYVVVSPYWDDTSAGVADAGAVTWVDGNTGLTGPVSEANSLHGTTNSDYVGIGGVVGLGASGNYVVNSFNWNKGVVGANVGAVTWAGNTGITGAVTTSNSLYGTHNDDSIGQGGKVPQGVVALSNGNYAVASSAWNNYFGAVTWGNGATGTKGPVDSATNSLVGNGTDDEIGYNIVALSNGNYVIGSQYWSGGKGAATWLSGSGPTTGNGTISSANSLVGDLANDFVGGNLYPLSNGNYVVSSEAWHTHTGAVTWGSGTTGVKGVISSATNSLVGNTTNSGFGVDVISLGNGNYVISSPGALGNKGAVTWGNGTSGSKGTLSSGNSLIGSVAGDQVGLAVHALSNGNYVVASSYWNNGGAAMAGAVTWGDGRTGIIGTVTASNSIIGAVAQERIGITSGWPNFLATTNGNYVFVSSYWSNNGTISHAGAVTLQRGNGPYAGIIDAKNSVLGAAINSGDSMVFDYSAARDEVVVGRPVENIVTVFRADELFKSDFQTH